MSRQDGDLDPTERFSDRVECYVRYRPGYPEEVLEILRQETGLTSESVIADVGSGTGISSELFLRHGNPVYGIEPNAEMRAAAEQLLQGYEQFFSIAASAESTGLRRQFVDYVVAAQAFHWFDVDQAKREFARILHPGGWVVLLWNARRLEATPFLRAYEGLLQRFGTDYAEVKRTTADPALPEAVFAGGTYAVRKVYNEQRFTFEGLKGRLLSSSYTPPPSHPDHFPMLDELERIFKLYAVAGRVCVEYDTEIYFGHVHAA